MPAKPRSIRWPRVALGLLLGSVLTIAAEEVEPGMEVLEYLGMWQETDEEWLMFDRPGVDELDDAADSAADAAEPMETDDES